MGSSLVLHPLNILINCLHSRFCKTVGYIKDVPKDGPYPKKLCFSFGDKTTGWQEPSAIPYNNAFRTSAFNPTTAFNGVHIKQESEYTTTINMLQNSWRRP